MLQKHFDATHLLLCGESHGVRENADIVYTLCRRLGVRQICIERSRSTFKPFIESALKGRPDFLLPYVLPSLQASMLSIEMLKVIVVLIQEGKISNVEFVDIDSTSRPQVKDLSVNEYMKERERTIAQNIISVEGSVPTLAVLGNYHTRSNVDEVSGESSLSIVRKVRKVTYLEYSYLSGGQYNAGRLLSFPDIRKGRKISSFRIVQSQKDYDDFVLEIPRAHRIRV